MRSLFLRGLFVVPLAITSPAFALKIAIASYQTGHKAAMAEAVVVEKVTSIEPERVELETHPGSKEKASFQVAVIKIETALSGVKNITHIKVAFDPKPLDGEVKPQGPIDHPGTGPAPLSEGQEGLFFLIPHTPGSSVM